MEKSIMRKDVISYGVAIPAPKTQIIIWLITFGKFGRVIDRKEERCEVWSGQPPPTHINCRCVPVRLKGE